VKLFISYSREDAGDFANHICRYLRDKRHDVFIDVNNITIGDPWTDLIETNISNCDLFMVILTPFALTSQYIENEVLQAQKQNKKIIPCIHKYVDYNQIKWGLEKIQNIKFSNKVEFVPKS
jgi:hypothetical protein